ncbi:hypothetical protein L2E82_20090 [Cichorium intybus]|uniref:Uncharacterized protein n=1 Tax=Cichorium intybus TaxID=13427 RepID=A0ACB9DT35_CICIN|nr:hypothetical protein L2E82_20090 [Cichorium intybus]
MNFGWFSLLSDDYLIGFKRYDEEALKRPSIPLRSHSSFSPCALVALLLQNFCVPHTYPQPSFRFPKVLSLRTSSSAAKFGFLLSLDPSEAWSICCLD